MTRPKQVICHQDEICSHVKAIILEHTVENETLSIAEMRLRPERVDVVFTPCLATNGDNKVQENLLCWS